jgi:hypothetical protein
VRLRDLRGSDLGKIIRVTDPNGVTTVTGPLNDIHVRTEKVDVTSVSTPPGERPALIDGYTDISAQIGQWRGDYLPPDSEVEIIDDRAISVSSGAPR